MRRINFYLVVFIHPFHTLYKCCSIGFLWTLNKILSYKCKEISGNDKIINQKNVRGKMLACWVHFHFIHQIFCSDNSPAQTHKSRALSRYGKQSLATGKFKANFFWVEWQGNIRRPKSPVDNGGEKKQTQKKDALQILKDPFIMSGCAVNLAD